MNLSQKKRQHMQTVLDKIREAYREDDEILAALSEIESELNGKKYGLVWETHKEDVDEKMQEGIPVFTEDKSREIKGDPGGDCHFLLEGDNLHSLRLLEKTHREKIDVIYIDPPYNTGNSFVYDDKNVDLRDSFRHSKWISFMSERLRAAHRLLSDNGIIFISIDDNEQADLRLLCNEIFGEDQFFAQIVVQSNKRGQTYKQVAKTHEYILVYTKSSDAQFNEIDKSEEDSDLNLEDSIGRYNIREIRNRNPKFGRFNRPNLFYPFYVNPNKTDKDGFCPVSLEPSKEYCIEVLPYNSRGGESCWRWGKKLAFDNICEDTMASNVVAREKKSGGYNIYEKYRKTTYKAKSIWTETEMITERGTVQLGEMGLAELFQFPKPVELIAKCLAIGSRQDSIILDFFAGSGTTGQAVLELNQRDHGSRRFILCTNNENGICENVTYQRLRTVMTGYKENGEEYSEGIPANLKYYRTGFISKESQQISQELLEHIQEMIQLEHGVSLDGKESLLLLCDEDADDLEARWESYPDIKRLYISRDVLLTSRQNALFAKAEIYMIPDHYFTFELREAGETW